VDNHKMTRRGTIYHEPRGSDKTDMQF